MLCPRCGQENPDHGQFCTQCGLPLTENAARAAASMTKNNGHSKGGRAFGAFCKAICYVLLFIILQSSVLGIYGGFVASSHMTDMFLGGSFTEQDMMQLMEIVMDAMLENISLLTLISGILTILFLAVFFSLRRKNLFAECGIRKVSLRTLIYCALFGSAFNVTISTTISLLPLPQTWYEALEQSSGNLQSGNLLLDILSIALITGLVEEMIFRGLAHSRLERHMSFPVAMILSSLIFGLCHGTPIAIGYATLLGIIFVLMNRKYNSLLPSVVTHIFFNLTSFWFVTENAVLILALALICTGVSLIMAYLIFKKQEDKNS